MRKFGPFRLWIFTVAFGLLLGIGVEPSPRMLAAASGPDFRVSDRALSHPLRIVV